MSNIIEGITKDLKAIPKNLKAKAGGMDTKKLVLLNLPYIFVGYFCDKVAWLWRVSEGTNASDKMMAVMSRFDKLFSNPLSSFHPKDLLIGVVGGIALRFVVYYKAKNAKKFRQGVEYGSARWGNAKDIEPYMDSVFENNVLLTQTERLMMLGRPKEPKYARNKNILVIGGSGSGKTRFFVKSNLMQMHSSYVFFCTILRKMEDTNMSEVNKNVDVNGAGTPDEEPAAKNNETKAEKFIRLGEYRMNKAIDAIGRLEHLANKSAYEYTAEQVEVMFGALESRVADVKAKFNTKKQDNTSFSFGTHAE